MNLFEKIAGNKMIANLAFKQIKTLIETEGIQMIAIFVNEHGDIDAKQYTEPVVVLKLSDYEKLIKPNTNE